MKNSTKIIVAFLFIIAVGVFAYYIDKKAPEENYSIVKNEPVLGCYISKLDKDIYTLKIEKEENGEVSGLISFNNFEKDSSSGAFSGKYGEGVLSGYYSFNSEGMNSRTEVVLKKTNDGFVRGFGPIKVEGDTASFEDISKVTFDPNQTFLKSEDCILKFTEKNDKFTFDFNPLFKVYEPEEDALGLDWRIDAKNKGLLLAKVIIPKAYQSDTNFSNAYLTIGVSTEPEAIKTCSSNIEKGFVKEGTKTISNYPFIKLANTEGAAGNFYDTTSYRGLLDGDCYVIEYVIHSLNIDNFSPEQGVKEFDKNKIEVELESMIDSFKFLVDSN